MKNPEKRVKSVDQFKYKEPNSTRYRGEIWRIIPNACVQIIVKPTGTRLNSFDIFSSSKDSSSFISCLSFFLLFTS